MNDNLLPAFPLYCGPGDINNAVGLTKRELFAAMAMQGMLAAGTGADRFERAIDAVAHADALLEALTPRDES